ncbi:MAG: hypothetical protein ACHP79_12285, partial [Terriglobales bacterium]
AQTIVHGIRKNKDRVLIGADAHRIDFFTRLMPVRASAVLTKWMQKRIEEPERAPEPKNPEPKNKEAASASR